LALQVYLVALPEIKPSKWYICNAERRSDSNAMFEIIGQQS
jgi:hypothetical protein